MREQKEVKIFITTTLAGPCVKDGWYAALLEYQTKKGPATMWVVGMEEKTTYYRSVLLAIIGALRRFNDYNCWVTIHTRCWYVIGLYERGTLEVWREKWKKSDGGDVKNKDLWQQFLEEANHFGEKDKISFTYSKSHNYEDFLMEKIREKQKEPKEKEAEKQQKR